jgi:hypothetical protein
MEPLAKLWTGIDTMKAGYYLIYKEQQHQNLMKWLTEKKNQAALQHEPILCTDNGKPCVILPAGRPCYQFGIQQDHLTIWLNTHPATATTPNLWVEAGPKFSTTQNALQRMDDWVRTYSQQNHATITDNRLTEIHLTTDIEVDEPHRTDDYTTPAGLLYITRSKIGKQTTNSAHPTMTTYHTRGPTLETFSRGKGDLMMRIYDKQRELHHRPQKSWERTLWTNPNAKYVLRTEFQLRRDTLREFGVATTTDMQRQLPQIWAYLTEDYFTQITEPATQRSRSQTTTFWKQVQTAWQDTPPNPARRTHDPAPEATALANQAAGCLAKAIAITTPATSDPINEIMSLYDQKWQHTIKTRAKYHRMKLVAANPRNDTPSEQRTPDVTIGGHVIHIVPNAGESPLSAGASPQPGHRGYPPHSEATQ